MLNLTVQNLMTFQADGIEVPPWLRDSDTS